MCAAVALSAAACTSSATGAARPSSTQTTVGATTPTSTARTSTSPRVGTPGAAAPTTSALQPKPVAYLRHSLGYAVPDPRFTPGSVLAVGRTEICNPAWKPAHSTIGSQVQNKVSILYGAIAGPGTTIHLDQLIPVGLGGDNTTRNVWPQAPSATHDGWKAKNKLEVHLHQLVCRGQVELTTAQHALAADWPAADRTYMAITVLATH